MRLSAVRQDYVECIYQQDYYSWFSDISISQSSVVTRFMCGHFIATFRDSVPVNTFENPSTSDKSYGKNSMANIGLFPR